MAYFHRMGLYVPYRSVGWRSIKNLGKFTLCTLYFHLRHLFLLTIILHVSRIPLLNGLLDPLISYVEFLPTATTGHPYDTIGISIRFLHLSYLILCITLFSMFSPASWTRQRQLLRHGIPSISVNPDPPQFGHAGPPITCMVPPSLRNPGYIESHRSQTTNRRSCFFAIVYCTRSVITASFLSGPSLDQWVLDASR